MPRLPFFRRPSWSPAPAHIQEQMNPTPTSSTGTEEDWYWGRATGTEEDYYWRRLSDNWYQKDSIPSTYLELHNACYEAYNANPLAFAIIEMTTSFVLGKGVTLAANEPVCNKYCWTSGTIPITIWRRASMLYVPNCRSMESNLSASMSTRSMGA